MFGTVELLKFCGNPARTPWTISIGPSSPGVLKFANFVRTALLLIGKISIKVFREKHCFSIQTLEPRN